MAKQFRKNEEEKDVKKGKRDPKKRESRTSKDTFKEEREKKFKKEDKFKEVKVEKEEINEVMVNEVVGETKKSSKKKTILSTILVIVSILLIVAAFVISVIETNEKSKYYNEISFDAVSELMSGEEIDIIYWASPNCSYCTQFTPVVKKVSYENELVFNYLNTAILNDEQYATMYGHFEKFDEAYSSKSLGTPSLILVQNGEIIDISVGALQEAELINYLKDKELIK